MIFGGRRMESEGLDPTYVRGHSGRTLFCARCKAFHRTSAELLRREDGVNVLRITCRVCGYYEDFVGRSGGALVPEAWEKAIVRYMQRRAKQALGGGKHK